MKREISFYYYSILLIFFLLQAHEVLTSSLTRNHLCQYDDALALLQFKETLDVNSSSPYSGYCYGISYEYLSLSRQLAYPKMISWNASTDCCRWDGVTCDHHNGHIIGLDLSCSRLHGTIPPNSTLFRLSHLNHLNLAFNDLFPSTISSQFGSLTSLTHLNLSYSHFQGNVASEISHLSNLIALDLSWNDGCSMGPINFQMMLQNLTRLRVLSLNAVNISTKLTMNLSSMLTFLNLGYTGLHGNLPSNVFHLPNIKALSLSGNANLSGSLPEFNCSIYSHSMKWLALSETNLSGILPDSIGCLKSLRGLWLFGSRISGAIPESIGNFTQLIELDLRENVLTGKFPVSCSNLMNLEVLDLSGNQLGGSISNSIFTLARLQYLDLSQNHFRGIKLSMSVDNTNHFNFSLQFLRVLDLSSCGIEKFPDILRNSESLGYLDLSDNKILGQIPSWFMSKTWDLLYHFNVSHNFLTGTMSQMAFKDLKFLDMSYNLLHGQLPSCICNFSVLQFLDLSSNNFFFEIPQCLEKSNEMHFLYYFDVSHNFLSGTINQMAFKDLELLDMSYNWLQGQLPSCICNLNGLQFLDLSSNNLSFEIPQCLGNSNQMSFLDLGNNNLYGTIPATFTIGSQLSILILENNQFEGPLPRSLANCTELELLDVGNNKIDDKFPMWLETLSQLKVLILKSNRFWGAIGNYKTKSPFPQLQIIDVSCNELTGLLPLNLFNNFKAMMKSMDDKLEDPYEVFGRGYYTVQKKPLHSLSLVIKGVEYNFEKILTSQVVLDFSSNSFEGEIPHLVGSLFHSLEILNLSHNNLTGHIPRTFGKLNALESLDLSWNQLDGTIPEELANLASLGFLNLSKNHLVGRIPQDRHFDTFGNDSYLGNSELCGLPLSKDCAETNTPPPPPFEQELDSEFLDGFTWKVVLLGYGCGLVLGLAIGCIMFLTGKPRWFIDIVDQTYKLRTRRLKLIGT